jgi:hypothetical protein
VECAPRPYVREPSATAVFVGPGVDGSACSRWGSPGSDVTSAEGFIRSSEGLQRHNHLANARLCTNCGRVLVITADEADAQKGSDGVMDFSLRGNVHLMTMTR